MDTDEDELKQQLEQARQLVGHLERGEAAEAALVIYRLRMPHERDLFAELGKLTRDLHEALNAFRGDARLVEITRDEIPDAKERLNYVVSMTEQATHRTLNAVETGLPIAESLRDRLNSLGGRWGCLRDRRMSREEFRGFARELEDFFAAGGAELDQVRALLSDILMAQDFQDLTGQIIARVLRLVQDLEENLVGLIRLSSARMESVLTDAPGAGTTIPPPVGPAVPNTQDTLADVVNGQDDVDALLSSLGF